MRKALVLGATGGMGSAIVNELVDRNIEVIAFARTEKKLNHLFGEYVSVTHFVGDVFDIKSLSEAAEGVDVIFHAINIPYSEWTEKQPKLMHNIIETTKQHHAKLAIVDNIYAYGRSEGETVKETKSKQPHTKKGKIRLQLEEMAKSSGIDVLIAHFPDFYGPHAENTSLHYTLDLMVKNKSAMFVGNQGVEREYIYTPDGAKAIVNLADCEQAYGQNWNVPGCGVITGKEIVRIAQAYIGYKKKVGAASKNLVRLIGIVDKQMREYVEMFYLNENPVVLDGSKYEEQIGAVPRTSYEQGIQQTLKYMQEQKLRKAND